MASMPWAFVPVALGRVEFPRRVVRVTRRDLRGPVVPVTTTERGLSLILNSLYRIRAGVTKPNARFHRLLNARMGSASMP